MTIHQKVNLPILKEQSNEFFFLCKDSPTLDLTWVRFLIVHLLYIAQLRGGVSILNVMSQLWDSKIRQS